MEGVMEGGREEGREGPRERAREQERRREPGSQGAKEGGRKEGRDGLVEPSHLQGGHHFFLLSAQTLPRGWETGTVDIWTQANSTEHHLKL